MEVEYDSLYVANDGTSDTSFVIFLLEHGAVVK